MRGNPKNPPNGSAEGLETRGNPRLHRRDSRNVRKLGQLGGNTGRRCWKSGEAGQPAAQAPAALKDARREAARRRIAGTAEERTAWGNLGLRVT